MNRAANTDMTLPLSAAQREIWLAEQRLTKASATYVIGECLEIDGPIDPVVFGTSLRRVVAEIEALHVRFVETDDGPRQIVEPLLEWAMPVVDVSAEPDPHDAAQVWISADWIA